MLKYFIYPMHFVVFYKNTITQDKCKGFFSCTFLCRISEKSRDIEKASESIRIIYNQYIHIDL